MPFMTEQELLLTALLNCPRHELYLNPRKLTEDQVCQLEQMQSRCDQGEPVQYVTGFTEFMGLKFFVDERVLIPRPETEFLIELILSDIRTTPRDSWRILEFGTGSGNIAVSLAKFVSGARVVTVDISDGALAVARENIRHNAVEGRVECVHGDMREILKETLPSPGFFDMIVANPPYIRTDALKDLPSDVQREPRLALDGGADGLDFYRSIIARAEMFLRPGSTVYFEIGEQQQSALRSMVESGGRYASFECFKDYTGRDRVVRLTR